MAIRASVRSDEDNILAVMTLAFGADPPVRWVFPDSQQFLVNFPAFARAFGGSGFDHGSAYFVDGYLGAALWLPPEVQPDEEAMDVLLELSVGDRKRDVMEVLEALGSHHPSEPHWYLSLIGVDPAQQGHGIGSALMKHALPACDHDKRLAYLEATSRKSVPLYQRHGFEVLGTVEAAGCPPIYPMLRKPQSRSETEA